MTTLYSNITSTREMKLNLFPNFEAWWCQLHNKDKMFVSIPSQPDPPSVRNTCAPLYLKFPSEKSSTRAFTDCRKRNLELEKYSASLRCSVDQLSQLILPFWQGNTINYYDCISLEEYDGKNGWSLRSKEITESWNNWQQLTWFEHHTTSDGGNIRQKRNDEFIYIIFLTFTSYELSLSDILCQEMMRHSLGIAGFKNDITRTTHTHTVY